MMSLNCCDKKIAKRRRTAQTIASCKAHSGRTAQTSKLHAKNVQRQSRSKNQVVQKHGAANPLKQAAERQPAAPTEQFHNQVAHERRAAAEPLDKECSSTENAFA